jgi:Carboxypeptidase regulatory-like domain/TonB dependent receptor/TonB-dependent Receptor Plug Domain
MKFRLLSALLALVLAVAGGFSNVAWAQTTGDIDGTVADQNGSPLPGVSVEIKSASLLGIRAVVTDGAGRFRFPALNPGNYTLTASLSGFSKAEKSNVVVKLGGTVTIPVTLGLSIKEEVVVTAEAPAVDTTRTTIGTNTSSESLQKLPLGRNFSSIAQRAPGTGTDAAGGATVYGATSLENQYVIDGVNTTGIKISNQGKQLNQEFIQEVEVKTGGYEAEYGRALGGTINVITKSGGNEFHGDAFGYYDSPSVAAADAHGADRASASLASSNPPKRTDFGADLGGFFVKDRLWFFGAFDRVNRDEDQTHFLSGRTSGDPSGTTRCGIAGEPACGSSGSTYAQRTSLFSGKLTFRLGESNTIAASAFGDPGNYSGRVISSTPGPDSFTNAQSDFGGTDFSAKYDGIFGTQFLAQAQFGSHSEKNTFGSSDPVFNNSTTYLKQQTGFLTEAYPNSGFAGLPLDEKYQRSAYKAAGTLFLGTNEVKAGVDYEAISSSFTQRYAGPAGGGARITRRFTRAGVERETQHRYYGRVPVGLSCLQRIDGTIPTATQIVNVVDCQGWAPGDDFSDPKTNNLALFAQDSFKALKNLTINAGIRYETQKLKNYAGDTVLSLTNEWSPRLGIVWDPLANGKSKVFGSYGRFYSTIPQDLQTRSLGRESTDIVYNGTHSNVLDPINTGNTAFSFAQTGDLVNSGLKGMYQDEIIAGVEYEVAPNWAVGLKGIYKKLGRVLEDRCDLPYNPDVSAVLNNSSDPYIQLNQPTCALINVDGSNALNSIKDPADHQCYPDGATTADGSAYVASSPCTPTNATRVYRGIELNVQHRFSQSFFAQLSYNYSKLEGNYSGNLSQTRETGQFDPNINADFDYPGLVTNSYGLLRNDSTHQAKFTGYYSLPFGLTAGLNFTFQSGRPRSLIGCPEDKVACYNGYSVEGYIVPKGSYGRLPSLYEGDFHLEYAVRFGGVSITPMVDIFNFLNRQGVTSEDDVYNNQGEPSLNVPCTDSTGKTGYLASCAPNVNYGKPIAWQAPRSVRFGARVSF